MNGPTAQQPRSEGQAPASRGRSATLGAVAFALLALPFLAFSLIMLNLKARVELRCGAPGLCSLHQLGWLGGAPVQTFTLEEIQGATVEHNRSSKQDAATLYKPVLKTTRGDFALSSQWLEDEALAARTANVVNRFHANPLAAGGSGFILFHDHRRGPMIVGASFGSVSALLFALSVWMAFKARRLLRAERAARASPPTT